MENLTEQIIELVHINPCLYDKRDTNYKDVKYKDKIWEDIGKQINLSVKECKVKWKSLRDKYRRQKMTEDLPSGFSQKVRAAWRYSQSLDFLAESMEPASTTSNICEELDSSVEWLQEESTNQSTPSTRKRKTDDVFMDVLMGMKRKYEAVQYSTKQKYDNFFALLSEKLDKLPENEVDDVQLDIFQLVNRKINNKN